MDETENAQARKTEPGFGAYGEADAQPLDNEMGELPAWLRHSVPPPSAGSHWKQTAVLWGGSLAALAVVFAGALWLFDEHNNERAMAVVAQSRLPEPPPAAAPQSSPSSLPPLVLLAPASEPKISTPAPVLAAPARALAPAKAKAKAPVARIAVKAPAAKPAVKPLLAKAPAKAPPPRKTAPQPKAKKAPVLAKHAPAPAKAKPKMLASAAPSPAKPAKAHHCQSGELVRDCVNRP